MLNMQTDKEGQVPKVSHEHWLRIKEHQERLRKVLVYEAKRDIYEKMILEQAALENEN